MWSRIVLCCCAKTTCPKHLKGSRIFGACGWWGVTARLDTLLALAYYGSVLFGSSPYYMVLTRIISYGYVLYGSNPYYKLRLRTIWFYYVL